MYFSFDVSVNSVAIQRAVFVLSEQDDNVISRLPESSVTNDAVEAARVWFRRNRKEVFELCARDGREKCAPKNLSRPNLWSGCHWRWFLERYGTKIEISFMVAELCARDPEIGELILNQIRWPPRESVH